MQLRLSNGRCLEIASMSLEKSSAPFFFNHDYNYKAVEGALFRIWFSTHDEAFHLYVSLQAGAWSPFIIRHVGHSQPLVQTKQTRCSFCNSSLTCITSGSCHGFKEFLKEAFSQIAPFLFCCPETRLKAALYLKKRN